MLQVENLYFSYDHLTVLDGVSFGVRTGQLCALFGPNASGKTTLLKCVAKLFNYHQGRILIDGDDIANMKPEDIAKVVAYVPQEHKPPFPYLVKEVVLMGRTPNMGGVLGPSQKDTRLAVEAMVKIGITDIADRPYTNLSGGQRQLVLLARALVQETKLLILDEPTSNLDFENQLRIWNILTELASEGITLIVCTHDPNHVLWFCDKVVMLGYHGVIASGNPREVMTNSTLDEIYHDICCVQNYDRMHMVVPKRQVGADI